MFGTASELLLDEGRAGNPPQALLDALGVWPSTASVSPEVALRVPAVSAAVRAISEAVACLPLNVCRVCPTARAKRCASIPSMRCFTGEWNDWTGAYDGLLAGTADALCNDNGALIWVNRIDGKPRELIRYRPGSFQVDRDIATDEPTFRLATADRRQSAPSAHRRDQRARVRRIAAVLRSRSRARRSTSRFSWKRMPRNCSAAALGRRAF